MLEEIDLAWVERNPKGALDMIDRLMTQRDEAKALAKAAAAGYAGKVALPVWQVMQMTRAEFDRQVSIGAGMAATDPETGLLDVSMLVDVRGFAEAMLSGFCAPPPTTTEGSKGE